MEVFMRIRFFGIAAGFSVLLPIAALAADPATTTPPAPPAPATTAQAEPLSCHYYYHEGMVIKQPVCRTEREWHRLRLDEQRWFREFRMRSLTDPQ
jgi:hypothetical protein